MGKVARIATVAVLATSAFVVGGLGLFRSLGADGQEAQIASRLDAGVVVSPAGGGASLTDTISALQQRLSRVPDDPRGLASLGLAYVQQARVTLDSSFYPKAEAALDRSLALQREDNADALVGMAALTAARHDFDASLGWAEQALATAPGDADAYGVVGDAQLELGRYDAAFDSYQRMVDTRPDLGSYARVAYARELLGDVPGAVVAMEAARRVAGTPADVAWTSFQLGELAFNSGKLAEAASEYRRGAQADPTFVANTAGLAKVAWARGDREGAIARYERVVARLPLPEHVIALGDAYAAIGDAEASSGRFELVRAQQQLLSSSGVNTDLELALFDADHGRPAAALRAARAEWERRRSVQVADALAWALLANDRPDEAWTFARRALSLGTRNASFLYHAGMIRLALGDRTGARSFLADALATNPNFSIQHADEAVATLERLGGQAEGSRSMMRRLAAVAVACVVLLVVSAGVASAHPLGNFTTNVYSGLHVLPGQVRIDYIVDLAEVPTFQAIQDLDVDGDGGASESELQAWADERAAEWVEGLTLEVDGLPLALEVLAARARLLPGQGGLDLLRFEADLAADTPRTGSLTYADANFPGRIGWREVSAVGQDGAALSGSSVPPDSVSDALRVYPDDLLSSPLDVRSATASFGPGASDPGEGASLGPDARGRPGLDGGPFAGLLANRGAGLMLAGVAIAIALGAWHALLPGHGKTLMAAYMVGSGARVRHAVSVGLAVSVMHTASVFALGLLVLTLERTFRPESLYPWLGLTSGLVALGLGATLLVARLSAWSRATRSHGDSHHRHTGQEHEHDDHGHGHGPLAHSHLPSQADPLSTRGLMALALAGGILPAPSALIVMLGAINAHRAGYGMALVLAFSIGLAVSLVVIGTGALKAREVMARRLSSTAGRLLPVVSAASIVGVGVFLSIRGLTQI